MASTTPCVVSQGGPNQMIKVGQIKLTNPACELPLLCIPGQHLEERLGQLPERAIDLPTKIMEIYSGEM